MSEYREIICKENTCDLIVLNIILFVSLILFMYQNTILRQSADITGLLLKHSKVISAFYIVEMPSVQF